MAEGQSTTNTRWIPAKEQIDLLEAMYREGIRNPTPNQIEEIAGRLRTYGTIQSKSVYFWFQNRKTAERRQKEKRVSPINQFLQPHSFAGTSHRNASKDVSVGLNAGNSGERRTLELFPVHPTNVQEYGSHEPATSMARTNQQPFQELRDQYRNEQKDASSGGGASP